MPYALGYAVRWIAITLATCNLGACRRTAHESPHWECPTRFSANPPTTARVRSLLVGVAAARVVVKLLPQDPAICYGEIEAGVVQNNGVFLLPRAHDDRANAARLAHLLMHRLDGADTEYDLPRNGTRSCSEYVQRAMASEERAHALESDVRRSVGLGELTPRLEELERAYRARCEQLGHNTFTPPLR